MHNRAVPRKRQLPSNGRHCACDWVLYGHFGTRTLRYQDSSGMVPKCLETLWDHTRTVLVPKCPGPEVSIKLLNAYRKSYAHALYRMMTFSMTFTDSYPRLQARIDSQPPLLTAVAPAASREFFLWQFYQKDTSMCPKNLTSILVTISISASWFFWPV